MDFSALGGCHQQIHQVPWRSSVSSEPSKLWLSRFFSFIPAGARLFCLGILALLLTLPCTYRVAAVTFAFNGIQGSDVYMMSDTPWTFQSNTRCFYFDPPEASWNSSVPGRFLYPSWVEMKDLVTKQVKSFRSTIAYNIYIEKSAIGPGKTFIVNLDTPTLGAAAEDYMGLLTANTSTSAKNYESDNRTFGVELDTFRNPEFNDPSGNNIGVDLANMLSTFIVNPVYTLASEPRDVHTQIWIDYFEVDSRMDIYIGTSGKGKPATPQGSQTGVDLSLLLENIGLSTAKWIEPDNLPCVDACDFSNADGYAASASRIGYMYASASRIGYMNTSASPIDRTFLRMSRNIFSGTIPFYRWRRVFPFPPSPGTSPNIGAFGQTPIAMKRMNFNLWNSKYVVPTILLIVTMAIVMVMGMSSLFGLYKVFQHTCTSTKKRKRHAKQRAKNEIEMMIYINKLLRLLFSYSGLWNILLCVILDYTFNDKPVRFTAFAIMAPIMIFLGFLASRWFLRIPLQFIAFVKRCRFLQHVVPCSPWHDNIETDFCSEVCTMEPLEQMEGTRLLDFPISVHNFLYEDQFPPQRTTHTTYFPSTLDSHIQDCQATTSPLELQGQDVHEVSTLNQQSQDSKSESVANQVFTSEILEHPQVIMATCQVSSPNLQRVPSHVKDIVVEMDHSPVFHISSDEQASILEFNGPEINGFPLTIQAFKNTSTRDHIFDLLCTFRSKKTKKMNLTTERFQNLVQNMCQWVKRPYPIVVDESSEILHCMAIQDTLWAFTKGIYTFNSIHVEHHFLAGMEEEGSIVFVTFLLSP